MKVDVQALLNAALRPVLVADLLTVMVHCTLTSLVAVEKAGCACGESPILHYHSFAVLPMRMQSRALLFVFCDAQCTVLACTNVLHVLEVLKS